MSFFKVVKCTICQKEQSIEDAKFPEDLFDLITKYKMDQLLWLCRSCKNDYKSPLAVSNFINRRVMKEFDMNVNEKFCISEVDKEKSKHQNNHDRKSESFENYNSMVEQDSSPSPKSLSRRESIASLSPGSLSQVENSKEEKSCRATLNKILSLIKIDPKEEATSKKIVKSVVLDTLLPSLKKNEEFNSMYCNLYYTGSSYNDLRITSATEYDIDLILKVPKYIKLTPVFHKEAYSFGKLKWETTVDDSTSVPIKFLKTYSTDGYLLPKKILSWLQSQIDLVLKQGLTLPEDVVSIKSVESGPARTIVVKTSFGYEISIDMVPVFEFDYSVLCDTPIYSDIPKTGNINRDKWFMVPKECQGEVDISFSESKQYWRMVYPNAEKYILSGKDCAKCVIKILKIFRDKRDWKALASYYLCMVVILEIVKKPESDFWRNNNLFQRLIDAFKQLSSHLKDRCLPHFLTKQNLLHKFDAVHCDNWHNYLERKIPLFEKNPDKLLEILEC